MQNSSNPVFSDKLLKKFSTKDTTETMTVNGSLIKTGFLLAVLIAVSAWSWSFTETDPGRAGLLTIGASISALVVALVIIFTKPNAILSILYAALQGVVIGSISFLFGSEMQGIVLQAISLTLAVTLSMLVLYTTGLVKVTEKLRSVIIIATVGVMFFYLLSFVIGLFSDSFYALVTTGSTGVVISGVIVLVAALNLLLDFDFIDKGTEKELPKQFEWYAAFGLMVTLVWLYISILRMLAASRN
jgi:uncharacterized YccA/Bax inhibitor family protein